MHLQYVLSLRQLILELANYAPESEEWEQCLERLCREVLKLRSFCRNDFQVCRTLYELVKDRLMLNLGIEFDDQAAILRLIRRLSLNLEDAEWINNKKIQNDLSKWAVGEREQAFKKVILMKSNRQKNLTWLDELAIMAKETQNKSKERQSAMQEIYFAITTLGKLYRPPSNSTLQYKQIYVDAINNTYFYLQEGGIEQWKPDRMSFLFFFNKQLRWKSGDLYKQMKKDIPQDPFTFNDDEDNLLNKIANLSAEDSETCVDCITRVLGDRLKNEHIRNHPHANLLTMIILVSKGSTWKQIGNELNITQHRAYRHFERNIPPFKPELLSILKGL
jgi:hypothetical protein